MMSAFLKIIDGRSPLLWPVRLLLWLLSGPYRLVILWRNSRFDRGHRVVHAGVPVISIGNLTTGGTGKTPMVRYVAQWLRDCGIRVTLLSRGYGAEQGKPNDEALELERRLPDVPHLQNPRRVESATVAVEEFAAQMLLLDDGFQHRFLARDLDIVLIDATCPFGFSNLLPAGLLREPVSSLARADFVIITRTDRVDTDTLANIRTVIRNANAQIPMAEFAHNVEGLENYSGTVIPCSELVGKKVLMFSGIGNHEAFRQLLTSQGIQIAGELEFKDHHHFDREDIESIVKQAQQYSVDAIICTMKDLVKIQVDRLRNVPLWALSVGLTPTVGKAELDQALGRIVNLVELDDS